MQIRTEGIVIKENNVSENDKYVTILTSELGTVEAYVKGARRKGSPLAASTGLFCYSTFVLFNNKSKYYVDEADINQIFYDLRLDLTRLTIASYFCQVLYEINPDRDNCKDILKLALNSIHLLANTKKDARIIKAAFELRIMVLSGLCPDLVACRECGEFDKKMRFYINDGTIICAECASGSDEQTEYGFANVTASVLAAMRHIAYSDAAKVFAFTLDDDNLKLLSEVCESYLVRQTERSYRSLEFLKTMME